MNRPTVSVVIAVTREHPHLLETLESIRKQTRKDIEILCGNSAHNRRVSHILRAYAKRRKNVRVFPLPRVTDKRATFNATVAKARGRFIACIDVGDIATKTRIAKQIAFLTEHPLTIAVGGQMQQYKKYARAHTKPLPLNHQEICALSFLSLSMHPSTIMVNAGKLPKGFRWYNQSLEHIQEFDLLFHLMTSGTLANLPDTLAFTHNLRLVNHAYNRGTRLVQSARAVYLAITRYGLTPDAKDVARATMRLFLL